MPLVPHLLSKEGQLRFREVNIFTNPVPIELSNERIQRDSNAWWSKIINNRRVFYTLDYLKHFADNLKPDYLFLTGDVNGTFSTRRNGQLYLFDLPLIILGLLYFKTKNKFVFGFLIFWLLMGIAPAGVARETPHALRTLNLLPVYQILAAAGFLLLLQFLRQQMVRALFVVVIMISFFVYLTNYYVYYPKEEASSFQYGYKPVMEFVKDNKNKYQNIFLTNFYGRSYIYYLWYTKVPAAEFLVSSNIVKNDFGFYMVYRFDNINFDIPDQVSGMNNLLVLSPYDLKKYPKINRIKVVKFPDGKPAFIIGEI